MDVLVRLVDKGYKESTADQEQDDIPEYHRQIRW